MDAPLDVIVAVPALRCEEVRTQLPGMLPNEISLAMPRQPDFLSCAQNLAILCVEHGGGLDHLAGALRNLAGGARYSRQLDVLRHRYVEEERVARLRGALFAIPEVAGG
ncbi:hypothetical protein LX88_006908 [Lentzea californiensis]|nr:hypothetical protein [Lentzea californiensis]